MEGTGHLSNTCNFITPIYVTQLVFATGAKLRIKLGFKDTLTNVNLCNRSREERSPSSVPSLQLLVGGPEKPYSYILSLLSR